LSCRAAYRSHTLAIVPLEWPHPGHSAHRPRVVRPCSPYRLQLPQCPGWSSRILHRGPAVFSLGPPTPVCPQGVPARLLYRRCIRPTRASLGRWSGRLLLTAYNSLSAPRVVRPLFSIGDTTPPRGSQGGPVRVLSIPQPIPPVAPPGVRCVFSIEPITPIGPPLRAPQGSSGRVLLTAYNSP